MVQHVSPVVVSVHTHELLSDVFRSVAVDRLSLRWGGAAKTLVEGRELIAALNPELVIMDTDFPDGEAWALIASLGAYPQERKIVVVSDRMDEYTATKAIRSPMVSYIQAAEVSTRELERVLQTVLVGGCYRSPSVSNAIMRVQSSASWAKILNKREVQLIRLFGEGLTDEQIAARLEIRVRSVRNLRDRLREKLGLASALDLAWWAIDRGIVHRGMRGATWRTLQVA